MARADRARDDATDGFAGGDDGTATGADGAGTGAAGRGVAGGGPARGGAGAADGATAPVGAANGVAPAAETAAGAGTGAANGAAIGALEPLRAVIERHGLAPLKSFGQHFLLDPGLLARIVGFAGPLAGRSVVEVGPGPGGLTRALIAAGPDRIDAVELDRRAIAALAELAAHAGGRLHVHEADAVALDLATLGPAPRLAVANLPYNVATPILIGLLRQAAAWERLVLMFQLEVAARITAAPDTEAYGRLAVLTGLTAEATLLATVPPGAFTPPPRVRSGVVGLRPHAVQPAPALLDAVERVTAAAFGQRRKMLRASLRSIGGDALLERAAIDGRRRAETIEPDGFVRLAEAWLANRAAAVGADRTEDRTG